MVALGRDPAVELHIKPHALPDVIFALPEDAVRTVVGADNFRGWAALHDLYTGSEPKKRLAAALGQSAIDAKFIDRVLEASGSDARPAEPLEIAMRESLRVFSPGEPQPISHQAR
jgi:hypothetical protein